MIKKTVLMVIALLMMAGMPLTHISAQSINVTDELGAAQSLYHLGLFRGVGTNPDGTRNFALDRQPTRLEAAAMFVRLVGGADEAHSREWTIPFTDVPAWGRPYIGYAFHNNLTLGVSATRFGSNEFITSYQYLTFVLRALGYSAGVDFDWRNAWILSDQKGITNGRFNAANRSFTRGDIAEISFRALGATFANSNVTLAESLIEAGAFTLEQAQFAGVPHITDAFQDGLVVLPTPAPVAGEVPTPAAGVTPTPQPVGQPSSIRVAPSTSTINATETVSLTASILPNAVADAPLTWSSSNTNVATVTREGIVTGVAEGTATITVSTENGLSSTSTITVRRLKSTITLPNRRLTDAERAAWIADYRALGGATANEMEVIRLVNIERRNHGLVEVVFDDTLMMAARFFAQQANDLRGLHAGSHNFGPYADSPGRGWYPWGASYNVVRAFGGRLRWSGGNWFSGGDMTAEALVRGWMNSPGHRAYILSPEHRYIGAGQFPGGISYLFLSDRASGQVEQAQQMPTSVSVSPTSSTINLGETQTIIATVLPTNATNRNVTWTSNNTSVASVSSAGVVTGRAAGSATITATTTNGLTATATVTVAAAEVMPTDVTVSPSTITLYIGETGSFSANVTPANAADRSVTWTSSNQSVATVSNAGVVTAVSDGTAIITATTINGLTATVTVTVLPLQQQDPPDPEPDPIVTDPDSPTGE